MVVETKPSSRSSTPRHTPLSFTPTHTFHTTHSGDTRSHRPRGQVLWLHVWTCPPTCFHTFLRPLAEPGDTYRCQDTRRRPAPYHVCAHLDIPGEMALPAPLPPSF